MRKLLVPLLALVLNSCADVQAQPVPPQSAPRNAAYLTDGAVAGLTAEVNIQSASTSLSFGGTTTIAVGGTLSVLGTFSCTGCIAAAALGSGAAAPSNAAYLTNGAVAGLSAEVDITSAAVTFGSTVVVTSTLTASNGFTVSAGAVDFPAASIAGGDVVAASALVSGVVTTGAQTFAGDKTINGDLTISDLTLDGGNIKNALSAAGINLSAASGANAVGEYGFVGGSNAASLNDTPGVQLGAWAYDIDGTPVYAHTWTAGGGYSNTATAMSSAGAGNGAAGQGWSYSAQAGQQTTASATGGAGGDAVWTLGAGGAGGFVAGDGLGSGGGQGGAFTFTAGAGGAAEDGDGPPNDNATGGAGGGFTFAAANGGAGTAMSGTGTGGAGGSLTFTAGDGGNGTTTGGNGGNITLDAGGVGTGGSPTAGKIIFQANSTEVASISSTGNLQIDGDIAIDGGNITTAVTFDSTVTVAGATATLSASGAILNWSDTVAGAELNTALVPTGGTDRAFLFQATAASFASGDLLVDFQNSVGGSACNVNFAGSMTCGGQYSGTNYIATSGHFFTTLSAAGANTRIYSAANDVGEYGTVLGTSASTTGQTNLCVANSANGTPTCVAEVDGAGNLQMDGNLTADGTGASSIDGTLTVALGFTVSAGSVSLPTGSVSADAIANVVHEEQLGLTDWVNATDNEALNYTSDVDDKPDFAVAGAIHSIDYDAVAGSVDADEISRAFVVPTGYVSGGSYVFKVAKGTATGAPTEAQVEALACRVSINGGALGDSTSVNLAQNTDIQTITVTPAATYAVGDLVLVACKQSLATADDLVSIVTSVWSATYAQ